MLRIQIGNDQVMPPDVFERIKSRFEADKEMGQLPMLAVMTDPSSGEATKIADVTDIGRSPDGTIYADLGIDICLNIEDDTARIPYIILSEEKSLPQLEARDGE